MSKVPDIVPVTDLRQDAAAVLRRLKGSRELLRLLARGERGIDRGEGHSLESVLRDADALLDGKS